MLNRLERDHDAEVEPEVAHPVGLREDEVVVLPQGTGGDALLGVSNVLDAHS